MVSTPERPVATATARARSAPSVPLTSGPPTVGCVRLSLPAAWTINEAAFLELCRLNELLQFETTEGGVLLIMTGEGWDTSKLGMRFGSQLLAWSDDAGGGGVGGASGTVRISETVMTIPDVCWISDERASQQPEDYDGILLAACPEFVIEIRSQSDSLESQKGKMNRWISYGALLGWLIDPQEETVWIYRPEQEPYAIQRPDELTGEDVCHGLVVNFARIWNSAE